MAVDDLRFLMRRSALGLADALASAPFVRWTWTSLKDEPFAGRLSEYRPSDRDSAREMMRGRFLLSSRLIDTGGASPFAVVDAHPDWLANLHGFSWLRHFRDLGDPDERAFVRGLALDWIRREGGYRRPSWEIAPTAQRVLNWLRHYGLLVEGASKKERRAIGRSLGTQVQSLRFRAGLVREPLDAVLVRCALLGVALCDDSKEEEVERRLSALLVLLEAQFDDDGLHRSRNPRAQLQVLAELVSLRQSLTLNHTDFAKTLGLALEPLHGALDALMLGTGEPAYFNGGSGVAHDLLIAVQAQGVHQARRSGVVSGYGIARGGRSVLIVDGGAVPQLAYAGAAHAGALGFEFSHGAELICGNCGPPERDAPSLMLRETIAHSAPTIDDLSGARLVTRGRLQGRLRPRAGQYDLAFDENDQTFFLRSEDYERRFGVLLERRITLLPDGLSLVGQDRIGIGGSRRRIRGTLRLRFHLSPATTVALREGETMLRLRLQSGLVWSFLWEGAQMHLEDSLRHSAHFGMQRTRQIVLEAEAAPNREIAWIFTKEER